MFFCRDFEKRKYLLLHVDREYKPSNNCTTACCARHESMRTCFFNACSRRCSEAKYDTTACHRVLYSPRADSRLGICTTKEAHRYFMTLNRGCVRTPGANKMHKTIIVGAWLYVSLRYALVTPRGHSVNIVMSQAGFWAGLEESFSCGGMVRR